MGGVQAVTQVLCPINISPPGHRDLTRTLDTLVGVGTRKVPFPHCLPSTTTPPGKPSQAGSLPSPSISPPRPGIREGLGFRRVP